MHKIMSLDREGHNFYYSVKPGDTLWSICEKYNVNIERVMEYNKIRNTSVTHLGRIILFKDIVIHEVCEGDTLESIAEFHDCEIEDIKDFNGLKGDKLYPGQMLIIKY